MSYIPSKILSIPKTLCIIYKCWSKAEENLRGDIRENYPDVDEEAITHFFYSQMFKFNIYKNMQYKTKIIQSVE